MDLIKITPNSEKARSILKMVLLIEERINIQGKSKMAALIVADYYEAIKELATALLLMDGYKTLSHRDLIEYLKKYKEFTDFELTLLDDLRVLRNRIAYDGFFVDPSYLERNESTLRKIIAILKTIVNEKIDFKENKKEEKQ